MKGLQAKCVDCGSVAISKTVDEVKPLFKMEIVAFACGATLKSSYAVHGRIGKVSLEGCGSGQ